MSAFEKVGYQFGEFCLRFKAWQHPVWLKIAYVIGGLVFTVVIWQFIFVLLFLGIFVWNSKQPDPTLNFDAIMPKNNDNEVEPYYDPYDHTMDYIGYEWDREQEDREQERLFE
ncbi:hypothetical protein A1D23_08415 [Chelonobacter oris]|uniref:hypothetical protein n=1 Tax=Chelonobacter oris TaxID=505317 RepID=UPI00244C3AC4|nr:hypothetical protein [Chelonobacter oris]MDH3000204.1 hypothetical protein [Chelonobacter oris]